MKNLLATLHDYDQGMLPALSEVWAVDSKRLNAEEAIRQLQRAMLERERAEAAWDKLDEPARTALQLLVSSAGGRMKVAQFERFYGKIRKLGRAQIEREKPHLGSESIAETLFYRGFIGEGYDKVDGNLVGFVYVPTDLVDALPLHKTSYDKLGESEDTAEDMPALGLVESVDEATPADTAIVDDMTALLAWLQATPTELVDGQLAEASFDGIAPLLLRPHAIRLAFMLEIGVSAELISIEDGKAQPSRDRTRAWLELARAEQIRRLAAAWLESATWRDMWHIPGLYPDDSGWSYDARSARQTVMELLASLLPEQGWISINDLIEIIKEFEPDFQRINGDYDSWYIRNDAGEYLSGFESWDAVEGSLIEFYLVGPMHWLGLVDIGDDVMRLTAYGRAFLEISDWPQIADAPASIELRNDGSLLVSRRVSRFERFQLARFARCVDARDPYVYVIDGDSIQRAAAQDITPRQIGAFLQRHSQGKSAPLPLLKLLRNWQDGPKTSVSFETAIVLRATSEETLEKIYALPALRRYLGARLGPMACIVRADQWEALRARLGEQAIDVDCSGLIAPDVSDS